MNHSQLLKLSDRQLVALLFANDESAIHFVFYEKFQSLLRFNATKVAGNKSVALDDLVQELYLYLSKNDWEKLRKYNPDSPFINWFSVVSYRFFKDFTNSMLDSSQSSPISEMNEHEISMIGTSQLETMMMDVRNAISKLWPPRDREIVEALVLNEEEPAEVAAKFHITVDNLYNIKRRALAKLIQKHLQDYVNH